jgi:hypothetical protein
MIPKSKNILDHIFNLAGIVRGILLGICLGIAGLVIVGFFEVIVLGYDGISDSTLYAILIVTIIVAIILGLRGASVEPKEITENTKKWVRSTWVSGRNDIIIPEAITLRGLLRTALLYALVLIIIVVLVTFVLWRQGAL